MPNDANSSTFMPNDRDEKYSQLMKQIDHEITTVEKIVSASHIDLNNSRKQASLMNNEKNLNFQNDLKTSLHASPEGLSGDDKKDVNTQIAYIQ